MDSKEEILDHLDEIIISAESLESTGYLEVQEEAEYIKDIVEHIKELLC